MKASQLTKENITPEIVDKLLFEGLDYKGEKADVIIVLKPQSLRLSCSPCGKAFSGKKSPTSHILRRKGAKDFPW